MANECLNQIFTEFFQLILKIIHWSQTLFKGINSHFANGSKDDVGFFMNMVIVYVWWGSKYGSDSVCGKCKNIHCVAVAQQATVISKLAMKQY